MYEHYRTGHTKLGFLNAETTFTLKILAIQPVFVGTALLSIFQPDMGYFFEVRGPFIALKLLQSYFCHLIRAFRPFKLGIWLTRFIAWLALGSMHWEGL